VGFLFGKDCVVVFWLFGDFTVRKVWLCGEILLLMVGEVGFRIEHWHNVVCWGLGGPWHLLRNWLGGELFPQFSLLQEVEVEASDPDQPQNKELQTFIQVSTLITV